MSRRSRTLAHYRERGFEIDSCDGRHGKFGSDLFGFADFCAFRPHTVTLIQHTEGGNLAKRRKKILAEPRAEKWLRAGHRIEIIDWRLYWRRRQVSRNGKTFVRRVRVCEPVVEEITLEDFGC